MPYTDIVLAYDGSLEGRRALREGAELAVQFKARTHLLAVIKQNAGTAVGQGLDPRSLPDDEEQRYRAVLEEGVTILKGFALRAEGHLRRGDPVDEIVKLVGEVNADLVVVGHRDRGALARWWRTPVSMSLLDKLTCSVLIGRKVRGADPAPD
ncbi:MAG TPA: universal stress protein [Gammaproteobacteria bacterium]|nr:universal stress protein [Gammaproteobacteria bacterium]